MKFAILLSFLLVPIASNAVEENSSVGIYADCVQWTTYNDVKTSKKFEFELTEDGLMRFDILFFTGSAECEGVGETLLHAENFKVKEGAGSGHRARYILARDEDGGDYYQLIFSKERLLIQISERLPVKYDANRMLLLKRAK